MQTRARLGVGGILLVAIAALIFGTIGGAVAANHLASTKVVRETVYTPAATPASITTEPQSAPMSWVEVARRAGPAVVTIINQQQPVQDIFGFQQGATDEGSGFVIDRKGDIVTNNHVIDNAQSLSVVFSDGHKVAAHIIRADPSADLAVIKVDAAVPAVLRFGDSNRLQPGEPVLAIGSALGEFRNTVTSGVVSALGRTITEPATSSEPNGNTLHNLIQTDAAINQGNSGGPLLDDRGEVVGVNTAITRGSSTDLFGFSQSVVAEGLGFAIPSAIAKNEAAVLVQNKPPALLGVRYQPITSQQAQFFGMPVGAYVKVVDPGSPAAKAGIKARDIITKIDNQSLTGTNDLQQIIGAHSPGDVVTVTLWRNSKTLTLKVKLAAKK
jgi:2-alkenal reductase